MDLQLDRNDIVAIAVVNFEDQLRALETTLTAKKQELTKQLQEFQEIASIALQNIKTAEEDKLRTQLDGLKPSKQFSVDSINGSVEEMFIQEKQVLIKLIGTVGEATRFEIGTGSKKQVVKSSNLLSANFTVLVPLSEDYLNAYQAIKATEEKIKLTNDNLALAKRKQQDIPSLERQARAKLAQRSLETAENGQAYLDLLADMEGFSVYKEVKAIQDFTESK
jgi:hypothetical protein